MRKAKNNSGSPGIPPTLLYISTNADIVIKDGGTLNVTQNSTINLRSAGGNLQVDKGGTMNMPQGAIY